MTVYHADRVRTHTEAGTVLDGCVVVDGEGLIAWVGPHPELPAVYAPDDHVRLDGTLLPGLVDTHVHLGFDGGATPVERMTSESDSEQLVLMLRSAREQLSSGVTTARDLGARGYLDVVVRDAVSRGDARGPRLVVSGAPLTPTGGHCWFMGGEADGRHELRTAVRRHHEHGVDSIKIMATGGFMTKGSAPWFGQYAEDELAFAIADAHRLGKRTVAHAHGIEGIRRAVRAGIDALEHCTFVAADGSLSFDPVLADEIAERGVFVSLTLNVLAWRMLRAGGGAFVDHFARLVQELHSRGVHIVVGTDAGIDDAPHWAYAGAMEVLAAVGLSVEEVLEAATVVGARSLGLDREIGRLAPGMTADLVGVCGDPATDLTCLRRPTLVVASGVPFTPDPYPGIEAMSPAPETEHDVFAHDH